MVDENLVKLYERAKVFVELNHYEDIEWSNEVVNMPVEDITTQFFLSELAWVIFCSGFRVSVVRRLQPELEKAFMGYDPDDIVDNWRQVIADAELVFNHKGKVKAVFESAYMLSGIRPELFRSMIKRVREEGDVEPLTVYPYIGDVTKYHLARNIGANVMKPDVHLTRLAEKYGLEPHKMVYAISIHTGDSIHLVDTVLWRYFQQGGELIG
jgi:3-methyladenine DNA glycosylase Tag